MSKLQYILFLKSSGHFLSWLFGFTSDYCIDPVNIIHHFGVNARFLSATTALAPADNPVEEVDVIPRTG